MESKRREIELRLRRLNMINFSPTTARDLRSSRPLLGRVERKSINLQKKEIAKQKSVLKGELRKIDDYMSSVRRREDYVKRRRAFEMEMNIRRARALHGQKIVTSVFSEPSPTVLSQPSFILKQIPVRRKTRLSRYKQRHKR